MCAMISTPVIYLEPWTNCHILFREANRALDWLAQFSDSKVLTTNQRDCQIRLEELARIASPTWVSIHFLGLWTLSMLKKKSSFMKKDKLSFWAFADLLWYATAKTIICWFFFKPVSGILFYDSVLMGSFTETTSLLMLEAPCTRLPFSCFHQ